MKKKNRRPGTRLDQYRIFLYYLFFGGMISLAAACYLIWWKQIPSTIKIKAGVEQTLNFQVPVTGELYKEAVAVSGIQNPNISKAAISKEALPNTTLSQEKIHINLTKPVTLKANMLDEYVMDLKLFGIIPLKTVDVQVIRDRSLMPAGIPIGIYVKTKGVLVVGTGEFTSEDGTVFSPSRDLLQSGDYIIRINEKDVSGKSEFIEQIRHSEGQELLLEVCRGEEHLYVRVRPQMSQGGEYKIGIWIRDNAQGVGTMTYVDEYGSFGALGHGINDIDTSTLMELDTGTLYSTEIIGITKGVHGTPGELTGYIEYDPSNIIGRITENTAEGIFGNCNESLITEQEFPAMPIALKQEVQKGPGEILCSIDGQVRSYEIEILELHPEHESVNRGIVIKITDPELLNITGGIVQGMSGSPIIQNGKLVGAVTHVLVNDPTRGYGIFIENMLDAAG